MDIKEFILKRKSDFYNSISLVGVIPFLVFVYLLVNRIASFQIFVGEIGYIMFITMIVFIMGIIVGRKMLLSLIQELIEKNRLATITETTLALSHEINNPLLTISGNLELLEYEFSESQVTNNMKEKINTIKTNCERIRQVTNKLSSLSKPVSGTIYGQTKMIDLGKSE